MSSPLFVSPSNMPHDAQICGGLLRCPLPSRFTARSYPVVPHGQARIRTQLSAAHSDEQVARARDAFIEVGKKKGII